MAELSRRAKKDVDQLPPLLRDKAMELIGRLDGEPSLGKKLKGKLDGLRSTPLGRTHRIIYRIGTGDPEVVTVVKRSDAYR
jgi:mRNA-degrading endonuclease RelE of RelBE toxin-antitoxin system